jgi:hypothetical protein
MYEVGVSYNDGLGSGVAREFAKRKEIEKIARRVDTTKRDP